MIDRNRFVRHLPMSTRETAESESPLLLVPCQDVSIVFGIVVALSMEHDTLTRREQSVAVLRASDHAGARGWR